MPDLASLPLARRVLMVSAAFIPAAPAAAASSDFQAAAPEGFEELQADRQLMLDVYFGGEMLGQARATVSPGYLKFDNPAAVVRLIPDIVSIGDVTSALRDPLPSNASLVCSPNHTEPCGLLQPTIAGVILDEDRFAVEVFIHPQFLATAHDDADGYLIAPGTGPSLISLFGATISGSGLADRSYHLQNRSVASIGGLRLRSDSSLATGSGLSFDNLTAESDQPDWRYLGGIFWAPGSDLVGRRKIAGVGWTTQLDTRLDKTALTSTPLTLFLQQPGRVELHVDGRLVSSGIHPAGHRLVDTSQLPSGSYDVVLRIQEDGRPVRTERRFFTKGAGMAPLGRPLISAFAGVLQTNSRRVSPDFNTMFYQASASYRVSPAWGVDASLLGTQDKAIIEAGSVLSSRLALVRVAGLASSAGDVGTLIRASTVGRGALALSFDLRTVKSRDGKPILPVSGSPGTFSEDPEAGFGNRGTYTQGVATIDFRLREGALRLSGLYRRDGLHEATYSVSASLDLPVIRTAQWDLRFEADVRQTEQDLSSFVGLRFLVTQSGMAVSGRMGLRHHSGGERPSSGLVAETQAGWYRQLTDHAQVSTDLAFGRDPDGGYARGSGYLRSPLMNVRADVLHQYSESRTTQFSATADAGVVLSRNSVEVGAREMDDAAAIIRVSGSENGEVFDVLVDEVVRGTVASGSSLALFLPPYESYQFRIRPQQAASFETGSRKATLLPGSVADLHWEITPLVILFGRVIGPDGDPIGAADVSGPHGTGRTDEHGYFQIEANRSDVLEVKDSDGNRCLLDVPPTEAREGYISAGKMVCQKESVQ